MYVVGGLPCCIQRARLENVDTEVVDTSSRFVASVVVDQAVVGIITKSVLKCEI
jgi:hypothetical protein